MRRPLLRLPILGILDLGFNDNLKLQCPVTNAGYQIVIPGTRDRCWYARSLEPGRRLR